MENKVSREDLVKALNNINEPLNLDIIKGKAAVVGEVRTWNGKKFKKQANGKWVEVSEQGMTKKEHHDKVQYSSERLDAIRVGYNSKEGKIHQKNLKDNHEQYKKLSDKEYDDTDFEEKEDNLRIKLHGKAHVSTQINDFLKNKSAEEIEKIRDLYTKDIKEFSDKLEKLQANPKTKDGASAYNAERKVDTAKEIISYLPEKKEEKVPAKKNTLLAGEFTDSEFRKAFKKAGAKVSISSGYDYYNQTIATISTDKGKVKWDMEKDFPLERVRQLGLNVETNHAGDIIVEESSEMKKSLQDHFNIINAPLNFNKEEHIQKSDVYYALDDNHGSQSPIGKFKKKGSELKAMAISKKAKYETKKSAIELQRIELASKIKGETGVECTEGEYGCKFNYNYDTTPQSTRTLINQYNNISYECEGINRDIKALNVIIKHCEDNKMYDVTARQLISLDDE